ncbi:deoxyribodipyrimidine photo-lyase [Celeribacter arenosi]|uniref:DNA photolyase PhrA n=1 Tax=Celeribacter arenosi TaxID=792649 RepID=A0ABP7KHC8_9RHOB
MAAIWWIRRDFRLLDNPALVAAARAGNVIPVFIRDDLVDALGAAPKWRLGLGLEKLDQTLAERGGRVVYRSGDALSVLIDLADETGAREVHWNRLYDRGAIERDTAIKEALTTRGLAPTSHNGHLLFEPWSVKTKAGGMYKVYTPFWNAVREIAVAPPQKRAEVTWQADAPDQWPQSEDLAEWRLGAAMERGAQVVANHAHVGEMAALERLDRFTDERVNAYKERRDFPSVAATSGLSENLTYGEISPRTIWHAGQRAMEEGAQGAQHFLKELVWREFAYHLLFHEPDLPTQNHREGWDDFPWNTEDNRPDVVAWKQGRTGEPFVDAAMREMYVTGTMHNRARMIVASYLTKHLLTDWRIGRAWFEECLIDWDPASNALGWQWVAGCGPDAAPYFRIFNPEAQIGKFDPDHKYLNAWIAEGQDEPPASALSFFDAVPKQWNLSPRTPYPDRIILLKQGRERALSAYQTLRG